MQVTGLQRHFADSDALNQYIRDLSGDTCLLSFSCGKDSIAAWEELRRWFTRIIPVYMYLVPDLEFVEDGLRYYEKRYGTTIIRLPHASLYRLLNNFVFQAPENMQTVIQANLRSVDYDEAFEQVRVDLQLPETIYCANGVRARDSLVRWASVKKHGSANHTRRTFSPVFDWNKARLIECLQRTGVKLPVDYRLFGRTFDGIDWRFLEPIKQHFPRDYARILEWFPLAELELRKYQWRAQYV